MGGKLVARGSNVAHHSVLVARGSIQEICSIWNILQLSYMSFIIQNNLLTLC